MAFNPFDPALFALKADCMPCCTPTPSGCECALLIPSATTTYADYATAAGVIAAQVTDCLLFTGVAYDTQTISVTTTIDVYLKSLSGSGLYGEISINLLAGETLSITSTASSDGTNDPDARPAFTSATLTSCDGSYSDMQDATAGVSNLVVGSFLFTAPADGEYTLEMFGRAAGIGETYADLTVSISPSSTWSLNPVIALWDDSGTTRQLWACPKLLLPPLTESTGDWYASCADASAILTDANLVSNCVGFEDTDPSLPPLLASWSFTATGGSSLSFSLSNSTGMIPIPNFAPLNAWGSFNGSASDTITVSFSASGTGGTGQAASLWIYDDTGTLVELIGSTTGTLTSSPLPYTGKYAIRIEVNFEVIFIGGSLSASATITSSGTMSVNPIQARYDLGLTCAGTLDCGDACP